MDVFVCPSCGFNLGEPNQDAYKATCRNCGRTVAITAHLGTTPTVVPTQRKSRDRWKTLPKKILLICILVTLAAGGFAFIARELTPTTPTEIIKAPYADLNTEEIDGQILSEGITALYYKGWTESETVTYIEARVAEFEATNETARERYLSSGMRASELNSRSTASDVKYRSKEEIQTIRDEIEARKELINKFERILADHRRRNAFF
jgi:hypothetical protein